MIHRMVLLSSAAGLLACGLMAQTPEGVPSARFRPESLEVEAHLAERAGAVAAALGFAEWPRPGELYRSPAVGRVLLDDPAGVAEEVRSCTTVPFVDGAWERCVWSWQSRQRVEGEGTPAAGSLDVEITVAPSSRAAQEALLVALADNMLPLDVLVKRYATAERPADLGDVAVLVANREQRDARLAFTRANVAFLVRGHGALDNQVLPLARRLDEQLLGQASLRPEQLRALHGSREKSPPP